MIQGLRPRKKEFIFVKGKNERNKKKPPFFFFSRCLFSLLNNETALCKKPFLKLFNQKYIYYFTTTNTTISSIISYTICLRLFKNDTSNILLKRKFF